MKWICRFQDTGMGDVARVERMPVWAKIICELGAKGVQVPDGFALFRRAPIGSSCVLTT